MFSCACATPYGQTMLGIFHANISATRQYERGIGTSLRGYPYIRPDAPPTNLSGTNLDAEGTRRVSVRMSRINIEVSDWNSANVCLSVGSS
jgi:hypothetical protein